MAETVQQRINRLMKDIGGRGAAYKPPDISKSMNFSYKAPTYTQLNLPKSNVTAADFQSLTDKKGINVKPLIDILSGTLGQFGGVVTDHIANVVDQVQGNKGMDTWSKVNKILESANPINMINPLDPNSALSHGVKNGSKAQWDDWTNGEWNWGDIPGVGFLHGMDQGWQRGDDIMDKTNMKDGWGKTALGIGIDVAADPLTYFTGGASLGVKAGRIAEATAATKIAKSFGIGGKFKNADTVAVEVEKVLVNQYKPMKEAAITTRIQSVAKNFGVHNPVHTVDELLVEAEKVLTKKYPNSTKLVAKKLDDIKNDVGGAGKAIDKKILDEVDKLKNQVKTVKTDAINSKMNNWGFSVPMSNKAAVTVGKIGPKNPLYRTEAVVGAKYAHVLDNLLEQATSGNAAEKASLTEKIKTIYGVTNPTDLTVTQYDDLTKRLAPIITGKGNKLPTAKIPPKVGSKGNKASKAEKAAQPTAPVVNAMTNKNSQLYRTMDTPFNEVNNAKTNFEHFLDKRNPFDARTFATGDKFLDAMANIVADTNSAKIGMNANYQLPLSQLKKYIKKNNLTEEDMKHAIYHIEGAAPEALGGKTWIPSAKAKALAEQIKPIIKTFSTEEQKAGVLKNLRRNYFPHMLKKDPTSMKKIERFDQKYPGIAGVSKNSKNSKTRNGFQTMAERDDYLVKLDKAIQKETDPDKLQEMMDQQARIENMFDTDVVSALTKRVKEGVRASVMKEMQGNLSRFGMMMSNPKNPAEKAIAAGLTKLDDKTAAKFGLGKGEHYMHEKVINGMKSMDEVFTDQGMNKMHRHLIAVTDAFRSLQTSYKLSHYRNNIIGNTLINVAAGIKITDYNDARKLLKAYKNGTLTPSQEKLIKQAYKDNVLSGGFTTDDMFNVHFDDPTKLEKATNVLTNNKAIKTVRAKMGEKPDDYFRLANYLNGMKKYGSTKKAAQQVREYLFNYNELTSADKAMRSVVPFWNWTKRNVPLQLKLLMENPKFALNNQRLNELFNKDQEGEQWQKDSGVKIPFTNYYTTIPSPVNDLEMLNPLNALSSMNPILKGLIETKTNENLFTGNPISYGEDKVQPEDMPGYLAKQMGPIGNLYDLLSGKKSIGESTVNYVNPVTKIPE